MARERMALRELLRNAEEPATVLVVCALRGARPDSQFKVGWALRTGPGCLGSVHLPSCRIWADTACVQGKRHGRAEVCRA
jgi:hypothetical protein